MAHIRSYFGIEREFDRYYSRLKVQLKGTGSTLPDADLVANTQETQECLWENPDPNLPLETGH